MTASAGVILAGAPREVLREGLQALGFDEVRFAPVGATDTSLRDWLAAGHQADLAWMERTAEKRMNPDLVLPGAKTVIMLGVNYWPGATIQNRESKNENPRWRATPSTRTITTPSSRA